MSEEIEKSWAHKIPYWQEQNSAMLRGVEEWKEERDEFLAEVMPEFICALDAMIEYEKAKDQSDTFIEIYCEKDEYRLTNELFRRLFDHYHPSTDYKTKLEIKDDHYFDTQLAQTIQPAQFWFRLTFTLNGYPNE